jgi:flavin reductase (DIM6/NTAB) family NADH-FMN oxidoreductase RutF
MTHAQCQSGDKSRTLATEEDKILVPIARATGDEVFRLLTGSVVPRPIAWTSTTGPDGPNLAPFSFFTVVSNAPPMLSLTLEDRVDGSAKDTLTNIRATREFVVNIAPAALATAVATSAQNYAADIDEFAMAGVTPAESVHIGAPRVAESPINFECVLHDIHRPGSDALIIGRVVAVHLSAAVLDPSGHINLLALDPLARMAAQFSCVGPPFSPPLPPGRPRATNPMTA